MNTQIQACRGPVAGIITGHLFMDDDIKVQKVHKDGRWLLKFQCPKCKDWGEIDLANANGHIGVDCRCGYQCVVDLKKKTMDQH